jgi:hypothetical protein
VIAAVLAMLLASPESYFDKKVAPILTKRCLPCHNNQLNNANVSFQDRATLLKGGSRGPAIVPGEPDRSIMIDALKHEGQVRMPPGLPLPKREIQILREWVKQGAVWGRPLQD